MGSSPAGGAEGIPSARVPETLSFNVRELLLSISADRLGFDPHKIPDDLESSIPGKLVETQLAGGKASVTLGQIIEGCPARFRPAFSRSDAGTPVLLPQDKIEGQLKKEADSGADFDPFAMIEAEEEAEKPAPEKAPAPSPFDSLPPVESTGADAVSPPPESETSGKNPEGAKPAGSLFGEENAKASSAHPVAPPAAPAGANPFSMPTGGPVPTSPWPAAAPLEPMGNGTPEPLESLPLAGKQEEKADEGNATPSDADAPAEATVPGGFEGAQFAEKDDKSTLRALFMTDEDLDPAKVIEYCGDLPGISACALFSADGTVAASSKNRLGFQEKAKTAHESLRKVVESVGMNDSGILTLRSDAAMWSFFQSNGTCVAVEHEKTGFQPGVQEKLGLVAGELASLAE